MARTPLYKAAETEMIRRIETQEWEVGRRLPNEFALAEEFDVSQGTMRRALMTLEGMGLLHRKPGRGTVVTRANGTAKPADRATGRILSGGEPVVMEVHRAKSGLRGADAEERVLFGTGRIVYLERLLKQAGVRTALEEITVPESVAASLDEDGAPDFQDFLEGHGIAAAMIDDEVGAAVTTMAESVALSCDRYTALLTLRRTARDASGDVLARQVLKLIADGMSYV